MFVSIIKELSGTKIAECNEICQALNLINDYWWKKATIYVRHKNKVHVLYL